MLYTLALAVAVAGAATGGDGDDLLSLSLEQLGKVQVTATSRRASRLAETPASVYVIEGEEIRALGIRTLPEALRLAPNLQVARINAASYAVSARGFKTSLSNKMLVMIDGRPIYTPLFAGVLWDMQDVRMADVDRIEVVSGPGAAAWGANAVNGVINIVTRPATETPGGYADMWAGEQDRGVEVGQTVAAGRDGALRLYGKRREQDASRDDAGDEIEDAWTQDQAGFRGDWSFGGHDLRVQGDVFRGRATERAFGAIAADGYNLVANWTYRTSADSQWSVLGYVDRVHRDDPLVIDDTMTIASLEAMQTLRRGGHNVTWGFGFRQARDESAPGLVARLLPDDRDLDWSHVFVQDEIALTPRLVANLGVRLDSNSYTGVEVLPTARVSYTPRAGSILWAAVSRAVRSPARFDRDFHFPASEPYLIRGGPDFESETVDAIEAGYRSQPADWLSLSVTAFHDRYDRLRGGVAAPQGGAYVANAAKARTWGVEAWATARVANAWEVAAGILELRQHRELRPGFIDPSALPDQGNDPEHQVVLRAIRRFGAHHQLSASARNVSSLPAPFIPAYTQLDVRWSYRPGEHVEFGIGARNLLDSGHPELQPANALPTSEFDRSVFADLRVDW
jgi:iron complex outermembrane receptor protein